MRSPIPPFRFIPLFLAVSLSLAAAPRPAHADGPDAVSVRSAGRIGAGAAVAPRVVATSRDLVRPPRDVEIELPDGSTVEGETVLVDDPSGVALVRVERALPSGLVWELTADLDTQQGTELPARQPVEHVTASEAGVRWVGARATVVASEPEILVSSPIHLLPGASIGAPDGGLAGIASPVRDRYGAGSPDVARVVPAGDIADALQRLEVEGKDALETQTRFFLRPMWSTQLRLDGPNRALHGPALSIGAVIDDRFVLETRVSLLAFDAHGQSELGVERRASALSFDAAAGYRFLLSPPDAPGTLHLTTSIGLGVESLRVEERRLQLDGGMLATEETVLADDELSFLPLLRAELSVDQLLSFGVEAQIDVTRPEATRMGIYLGFGF